MIGRIDRKQQSFASLSLEQEMFCLSVLLHRQKPKVAWSRVTRMHAFYWVLKCPTAGRVGFLVSCCVAFGVGIIEGSWFGIQRTHE